MRTKAYVGTPGWYFELAEEFYELLEAGEVTDIYDFACEIGLTQKQTTALLQFL